MKVIETERLILRAWKEEDILPFSLINKDIAVMEYMPGCLSLSETEALMRKMAAHYDKCGFGIMAVELKETGDLIGYVGLKNVEFTQSFTPAVEIAWRVASPYWGKGYATEGAKAALAYGFNTLKLKEIVSFTVPDNKRSIRVMEKIGLTRVEGGEFDHPKLPADHPLSRHVLYSSQGI